MDVGKDLVAASATPLVLAILAEGDSYGYAIIKRVSELSGGHLQWTDGMLYPVLHRLERQGLVAAKWGKSETGRRRKYYRGAGISVNAAPSTVRMSKSSKAICAIRSRC
jgi:PadR family transcriptional regulator PadR